MKNIQVCNHCIANLLPAKVTNIVVGPSGIAIEVAAVTLATRPLSWGGGGTTDPLKADTVYILIYFREKSVLYNYFQGI